MRCAEDFGRSQRILEETVFGDQADFELKLWKRTKGTGKFSTQNCVIC